jgi:sulfide:quinone oxidoreductase
MLKKDILPFVYWKLMLKGHEWLARPEVPPAPAQTASAAGAGSKAA